MGNLISRLNNQLNTVEEVEATNNYKYPPKAGEWSREIPSKIKIINIAIYLGNFFSTSFIMGGERFDQTVPESYLFGENADLNWLGSKPIAVKQAKLSVNISDFHCSIF